MLHVFQVPYNPENITPATPLLAAADSPFWGEPSDSSSLSPRPDSVPIHSALPSMYLPYNTSYGGRATPYTPLYTRSDDTLQYAPPLPRPLFQPDCPNASTNTIFQDTLPLLRSGTPMDSSVEGGANPLPRPVSQQQ